MKYSFYVVTQRFPFVQLSSSIFTKLFVRLSGNAPLFLNYYMVQIVQTIYFLKAYAIHYPQG